MIRNKKAMLFCSQIILTGALLTGAPCLASGSEPDYSGEGQIHKPESLEAPDYTSDPDFVDDSTDNTYGYYTIMGETTVSLAQMTSQYEEQRSRISVSHVEGRRSSRRLMNFAQ